MEKEKESDTWGLFSSVHTFKIISGQSAGKRIKESLRGKFFKKKLLDGGEQDYGGKINDGKIELEFIAGIKNVEGSIVD